MKLWKSPVFYFGILLVTVVAALLLAPLVIDWNGYRADLENYGRKLTGRDVTISGDITARLFPWPKFVVEDVHIANPPGLQEKEFASAARIVVRMTLAGLFNGSVDVESIDVEQPAAAIERLESGNGNWSFSPAADLAGGNLMERVKLDRITLLGGKLRFIDRRRGETHQLDSVNATLSAPGISGPWRVHAVGLRDGLPLEFAINTAAWRDSEPFRFGLRAAAADGSGLAFVFDGAEDQGKVTGQMRIEPAAEAEAKSDAEGEFRPLIFTSQVSASFDAIAFDKIEIAPKDIKDGGTLLSGSAGLTLGSHITANANLSALMLDVDEMAGARARSLVQGGGVLALANGLLALLPGDVSLSGALKIAALKTGGETLDNVVLSVDAAHDAIRVKELSASLPGHSRALFKGVFFPGNDGAELAGSLAVESSDTRQLTRWIWPAARQPIASLWTGTRGHFKLQTDVNVTQQRLRLSKTQYELDGEQGSGGISYTAGGRGAFDIRLEARHLDIDSYVAGGVKAGAASLGGLLQVILPHPDTPDIRVTLKAGEMLLNGVTASGVLLDAAAGNNGLDLRSLEIGSVGGARLTATGLILDNGSGPDGSIGIEITADDPRELLRLAGVTGNRDPAWTKALGATALKGTIAVRSRAGQTETTIDASGSANGLEATLTGQLGNGLTPEAMKISGTAEIVSPTSGRLAALAGLAPAADDSEPAKLTVTASGTAGEGFAIDAQLQAFGGRFDFNGTAKAGTTAPDVDGKLALRVTDTGPLLLAAGLPLPQQASSPLVLDSSLTAKGGVWSLPDLAGRAGSSKIAGAISLAADMKLTGNIETGAFALRDLLAILFLRWSGDAPGLDTSFAPGLPFGINGELWIKPQSLVVHDQFTAKDVQIGITAAPGEIHLAMFGKDDASRDAHIEIGSKGVEGSRRIDGRIGIPVDLGHQLRLAGGSQVAVGQGTMEVEFQTDGRSAGGALSALKGNGSYTIDGLALPGVSPDAFTRALQSAHDSAGLTAAFDALRGPPGISIGKAIGYINIDGGVVNFQPIAVQTPDADVEIKVIGELALGAIDAAIGLKLKARPGLPPMSIAYAGPPLALARSEDNSEIATSLGVALMQQGVDELERLQKEQQRLAAEEEKQRIEDEAKLQAYYAQRDEVLLRKREIKVHGEMRLAEAERLRQKLEAESAANLELNRGEMKQRLREIRIYRRLAKLQRASEAEPAPAKPRPAKPQPVVSSPAPSPSQ